MLERIGSMPEAVQPVGHDDLLMSMLVIVTFDLHGAKSQRYRDVKRKLAALRLEKYIHVKNSAADPKKLPDNTLRPRNIAADGRIGPQENFEITSAQRSEAHCTHIANAPMRPSIERLCREEGFEPPILCTPEELLED